MKVSFGIVGGKEWDGYTQKVLRLKFESEDYVPVPSKFGGDLGIESFTKGEELSKAIVLMMSQLRLSCTRSREIRSLEIPKSW